LVADVVVMLLANTGVLTATRDAAPDPTRHCRRRPHRTICAAAGVHASRQVFALSDK
jgi:hypothetical protein